MLQSSAYRQKRSPRRANSLSRSSSTRLLKRGESGPPCGVPSSTGLTQAALHHPGLEKGPNELPHAFIRHPRGNVRHQAVVIDSVEEFFEIEINHHAVALGDVSLCLGHRLMGGSPRSEAVTVRGEIRVPPLLENLQQGLLDQPVDDARHAELSDPATRLGYFDPLDRLRLIGSFEQLRP